MDSDFIWDFGKLPFPLHFFYDSGKKSQNNTNLQKLRPFFDWE